MHDGQEDCYKEYDDAAHADAYIEDLGGGGRCNHTIN